MTETYSKPRQQAELAFTRAQSDFWHATALWKKWMPSPWPAMKRRVVCGKRASPRNLKTRTAVTAALLAKRSRKALRKDRAVCHPMFRILALSPFALAHDGYACAIGADAVDIHLGRADHPVDMDEG